MMEKNYILPQFKQMPYKPLQTTDLQVVKLPSPPVIQGVIDISSIRWHLSHSLLILEIALVSLRVRLRATS